MREILRLTAGFVALTSGALVSLLLPEVGIPLLLVGTRLLGDRYKWAKTLNQRVDLGWSKTKAWLKKRFRR
jgi:hypothetical protein